VRLATTGAARALNLVGEDVNVRCLGLCCALAALACGSDPSGGREELPSGGAAGTSLITGGNGGGGGPDAPAIDAGNPEPDAAIGAGDGGRMCGVAGCGQTITGHQGVVDMLFVIDTSSSMMQEQASLAEEFPRLMRKLTSGDHDEDGDPEYEPVRDLHLGVVSTNLGSGAARVPQCEGSGDSGILLHTPTVAGCERAFPKFLEYRAQTGDPDQVAADFACLAQLGITGCGFEQPLESALQALWPSADPQIGFVSATSEAAYGRGDRENAGFLRNDPDNPATLAIVIVSDEDDCSAFDTQLWLQPGPLPPEDPLNLQDLNLRCFYNPNSLYDLERYAIGYRALHGWTGARVLFAAIVGVPVELVDQNALASVDWNDDAQREAHYDKILNDPMMEEVPIEKAPSEGRLNSLRPSCDTAHGLAWPPRRIVSLARKFGPNSLVQSICGDNLGPPIDIIIRRVLEGPE
jgi:hypothetical protein